jgi:hypothetical protein
MSPGVIATPRNDTALSDKEYAKKYMKVSLVVLQGKLRIVRGWYCFFAQKAGDILQEQI